MPVIDVSTNPDDRSIVITAEFAAPLARVWQLYADPRQLERVWGPPTHPATVVEHALTPGGRVLYYMTGPEGEKYYGGWRVLAVDEPNGFTFEDFFADEEFRVRSDLPVSTNTYAFEAAGAGTRATFSSTYETAEALAQVLEMGMEEGATLAINQIDALLAEG
ncbi:MAG: SRPBCC domain-containing protein [Propionicimonas sp.]|uniref:SRPBCC family protein n=1 Tax=Propionicimonas sp. TaxID=1955623 RepID=UPI003D112A1C